MPPWQLEDAIADIGVNIVVVPGATLALSNAHNGKLLRFSQACTVTIPSTLQVDFSCGWSQESNGAVTFAPGPGTNLTSYHDRRMTGGRYLIGGIVGLPNSEVRLLGHLI